MKKEWNTPAIFDLTIRATEHRGKDHKGGRDNDDICKCQGGTSPCYRHEHFVDKLS